MQVLCQNKIIDNSTFLPPNEVGIYHFRDEYSENPTVPYCFSIPKFESIFLIIQKKDCK